MFVEVKVYIYSVEIKNSILKNIRLDKAFKNKLNNNLIKVNIILKIK